MAIHKRPNKKTFALLKGRKCFAIVNENNKRFAVFGTVLLTGIKCNLYHYNRAKIKEIET